MLTKGFICLWVWMTTLNSEEITLCSDSVWGESTCLWVWMTTLNSEEITLCSDSVDWGGPSAFESEWQHWTVKRSLCALTVLTRGWSICLWVWMTTLNSDEITLCSDSVLHIGGPSTFESEWQHLTVKRSLYALTVFWGVHLSLSLNDNIEQWRDHSVLWQCWPGGSICLWVSMTTLNSEEITLCSGSVLHRGGPSALWVWMTTLNSEEITLCSDSVDQGGSICLWVWMTTLNSEEITLCSDSVDRGSICLWVWITTFNSEEITLCSDRFGWGVHLHLSLNDNIEQWRDHSVLWQCCTGGIHLPLSLNDNIEQWRDHSVLWQCWPGGIHLPLSLNDNIEQWRDNSVLWQCWPGGIHLPLSLNDNI